MGKMIDLTGQTFGKWTVLRFHERRRTTKTLVMWWCRCACGREASVIAGNLRSGASKGCQWCYKHELINLSGQAFGLWIVLRFIRIKKTASGTQTMWLCRCKCGMENEVPTGNLRAGLSKGCPKCRYPDRRTHGASNTPLYNVWAHRKSRHQLVARWNDDYAIFRNEATGYKQGLILKPIRRDELIGPGNFVWRPLNDIEADVERTMEIMGDDSPELRKRLMVVSNKRRWQLRNKARGLCEFCSKPSIGARFCLQHLIADRKRQKIKDARKRQKSNETKT